MQSLNFGSHLQPFLCNRSPTTPSNMVKCAASKADVKLEQGKECNEVLLSMRQMQRVFRPPAAQEHISAEVVLRTLMTFSYLMHGVPQKSTVDGQDSVGGHEPRAERKIVDCEGLQELPLPTVTKRSCILEEEAIGTGGWQGAIKQTLYGTNNLQPLSTIFAGKSCVDLRCVCICVCAYSEGVIHDL
eukprot:scaffold148955_cov19-Tisochrysis_lutea.AAC.2